MDKEKYGGEQKRRINRNISGQRTKQHLPIPIFRQSLSNSKLNIIDLRALGCKNLLQ